MPLRAVLVNIMRQKLDGRGAGRDRSHGKPLADGGLPSRLCRESGEGWHDAHGGGIYEAGAAPNRGFLPRETRAIWRKSGNIDLGGGGP